MNDKFHRTLQSISKQQFIDYYFSHSRKETQSHFNIGNTVFDKFMKYYNIVKPKELINAVREETNTNIYGVANQFQRVEHLKESYINVCGSIENHKKKCVNAFKKSVIEKYGDVGGASRAGLNTRKALCKSIYDADYYVQSDDFKNKSSATKEIKYNDKGYHNINKMIQTNLERYGVKYNFSSDNCTINGRGTYHDMLKDEEYKNAVNSKRTATCKEKYGEDFYLNRVKQMIETLSSRSHSKTNKEFKSYLLSLGIPFETEFNIGKYFYDFKLGKYLLEIDPYSTHNTTWGVFNNPKSADYHRLKTLNAFNNNYTCLHIFDWTNVNELIYNIVNKNITIEDTSVTKKYIYDTRQKKVVDTESNDTVVIYDDGFREVYTRHEN